MFAEDCAFYRNITVGYYKRISIILLSWKLTGKQNLMLPKVISLMTWDPSTNKFTFSALQTKTYTFANSDDPDEMACNKLSHQGLHCLPVGFLDF